MNQPANDTGADDDAGDDGYIFGPGFFLKRLSAFARDRCPDPKEHLPSLSLHLHDGEVLEVCHIIGVAPHWIALAVFDGEGTDRTPPPMATELVPYPMITRVTIRSLRRESAHLGFDAHMHVSRIDASDRGHSAEDAFGAAMREDPAPGASDHCGTETGTRPRKEEKS